jgi:transposase-like protein
VKRKRRTIDSALKAKIALEALGRQTSIVDLAQQYGVHPNQIYAWKKQLQNYAVYAFNRPTREIAELQAKVSRISRSSVSAVPIRSASRKFQTDPLLGRRRGWPLAC